MWPPSIVPLFLETIRVVALTPDGASLGGRVRTPRGRWPGFAFLEHRDLADTAGPDGKTARRPWDRPRRRLPGPSVSFCHLSWPVGPVTRARSRARRAEGVASTHKGQAGGNRGGGRREGPTASRTRTRVCRGRWGCCRTVASRGRGASGPGTSRAVLHAACSLRCLDSGLCGPVLVCAGHQQNEAWGSGLGGTPRCSLLSRPEQPLPCVEKLHPATFFCSDGDPVTALVPSCPF